MKERSLLIKPCMQETTLQISFYSNSSDALQIIIIIIIILLLFLLLPFSCFINNHTSWQFNTMIFLMETFAAIELQFVSKFETLEILWHIAFNFQFLNCSLTAKKNCIKLCDNTCMCKQALRQKKHTDLGRVDNCGSIWLRIVPTYSTTGLVVGY